MRYPHRLIALFLFAHTFVYAQRIDNVKAATAGDKVVITYDINDAAEGQKFKVRLYASHDNYSSPLAQVSGDVGQNSELFPGISKRIEWNAKSELKEFDGDITFEVRADVISTGARFVGPSLGAKVKRGKNVDIQWKGIGSSQIVKLELLKGGYSISQIGETSNRTNYTWTIPKAAAKGKDYQIKLTTNSTTITSDVFTVKSRTPFIVKVLPIFVAGGVAAAVLTGGGSGDEGGDVINNDLPAAPGPPSN
jgi:hypothetical protein